MSIQTYNKPRKASILYLKPSENFRDVVVSLPKRSGWALFKNSTLLNPYVHIEYVTKQLAEGTHKFRIKTVDELQNISTESDTAVNIGKFTLPPRFLTASISGSTVTLTWQDSIEGAPDSYEVMGASGFTTLINRAAAFNGVGVAGTINTVSFNVPAGEYRFTVDAIKDAVRSFNHIVFRVKAPSTAIIPPTVVYPPIEGIINIGPLQVFGVNVPTGKLRVQFIWPFNLQAEKFRLYHDSGTGTVNFGVPIEFDRINNFLQDFTTDQISFQKGQQVFKFVIRSVTSAGVEDDNLFENEVLLDGGVPDPVTNIKVSTTFC